MKTIDAHVAKRYLILKATGATVWEIVWRTPSNIKKVCDVVLGDPTWAYGPGNN